MNIKKRTLASLMLMGCIAAQASAQQYMVTYFNDGTAEGVTGLSQIMSLRFSDGNLQVKQSADGQVSETPLAKILSIKFSEQTTTGVTNMTADQLQAVTLAVSAEELRLVGYNTANALPAALYSINGSQYYACSRLSESSINISSLPKGIYIFKLGNKSYKIRK